METIQNFPKITKKDFPLLDKNLKSDEQIRQ
jgi:cysteine desulfurase/selenocysteine lyase